MALDHPARILFNEDGTTSLDTEAGSTPASLFGFIGIAIDGGGVARAVLSDTSGRQVVVGAGTAGTPAGGVVTIQGVSGGVVVPVSDGGGSLTVDTPQLPAALVGGRLDANVGAWFGATTPTVGQKAMAASIPVTIASDQTAVPVSQGSPPWAVKGTDADGAPPTEDPVLTAGFDGTNVQTKLTDTAGRQRIVGAGPDGSTAVGDPVQVAGVDGSGDLQAILTETDGSVRTKDDFVDDRDKVVAVSYVKLGVTTTSYYMLIDLSNTTDYPHANGTGGVFVAGSNTKGVKTNSGARWAVEIFIVAAINGTDSTLVGIAGMSFSLRDSSILSSPQQILNFFPKMLDLTVSGGALVNTLSNFILTGVTDINTGTNLEDAAGNSVAPAVGDVIIRAELISGGGTLDFAVGAQYYVE